METTYVIVINYEGEQQGDIFVPPEDQEKNNIETFRGIMPGLAMAYDTGITVVSAMSSSDSGMQDLTQISGD
jgi:hypothetical protein